MSGRFGPTAITTHQKGNLYVAHFEYAGRHLFIADIKQNGVICVINPNGDILAKIPVLEYAEIMGMQFSKMTPDILFFTVDNMCHRFLVNNDFLEKTQKDKRNQIESYEYGN